MRNNSSRRAAAPAPKRTTIRTAAVGVAGPRLPHRRRVQQQRQQHSPAVPRPTRWRPRPPAPSSSARRTSPRIELLAQIYADALQGKGIKVTTKFNIGAREVYYPEVVKGAITIIPEYNGALLTTSVDPKSTATSTADVNAELKAKLPSSVEILNSAPAQDKDSITVTQATATKYHLTSISDLAPVREGLRHRRPAGVQDARRRDRPA